MGKKNKKPSTKLLDIETRDGGNSFLMYAVTTMQGHRDYQEDRFVCELLQTNKNSTSNKTLFGVFDGHGGHHCSTYLSKQIVSKLTNNINSDEDIKRTFQSLDDGFLKKQIDLLGELDEHTDSGSTACCVFLTKNEHSGKCEVVACNTGDSRFALYDCDNRSEDNKTIVISSVDHKGSDLPEQRRIEKAGGFVAKNGRVNNILAMSRAFGDFLLKNNKKLEPNQQPVICEPDVIRTSISLTNSKHVSDDVTSNLKYKFVLIASDGLWDVLTIADCEAFVVERLNEQQEENQLTNEGFDAASITEELARYAVYNKKSMDNITIILVILNTKEGNDEC
ncbi:protein phosphatase [Acrasis kona]|uniref:Protein phosphatase n=1 Tax=Acrasis kona TaxID=1008807 RepID=A0AAW2YUS8_9EUKA